jgi:hypothetical protein
MRIRRLLVSISILACAAAFIFAACSSSPKSGGQKKKRTILLTEYDDARVGAEASRDVEAEIGLLGDPELDAYVSEIGRRLLRGVPRRSFHYQFAIVDQFEPNAFALPGGYIFISRGLLALANSEDELANTIGHEIVHAARRHASARQAVEQQGNPLSMPWVRAANLAAYGRDMERTADRGGQMLAAASSDTRGCPPSSTRTPDRAGAPPPTPLARARSAGSGIPHWATRAAPTCAASRGWPWGSGPRAVSSRATTFSTPISTSRSSFPMAGAPRTPRGGSRLAAG